MEPVFFECTMSMSGARLSPARKRRKRRERRERRERRKRFKRLEWIERDPLPKPHAS
jgi:hypothetical protein